MVRRITPFIALNDDQKKLSADLLNTVSNLFIGGGLISPFLVDARFGNTGAVLAIFLGCMFHAAALYVSRTRDKND